MVSFHVSFVVDVNDQTKHQAEYLKAMTNIPTKEEMEAWKRREENLFRMKFPDCEVTACIICFNRVRE
jgi:hypothetical protein